MYVTWFEAYSHSGDGAGSTSSDGYKDQQGDIQKGCGNTEKEFVKEVGGKKILKPGDLGYIHRTPRKRKKREPFPEIDSSKTYGREDD